jgi:hypothetical protein
MTLRADSYGTVAEVRALTRHLLDGSETFDTETRPTIDDVETFIDRASGMLNAALASQGFTVPITNSTAMLACDEWVVTQSARAVELTQRGTGYSEAEGSRLAGFSQKSAMAWVKDMAAAFQGLGLSTSGNPAHEGLVYTGLNVYADRSDATNTSYEQPKFRRGQFDAP